MPIVMCIDIGVIHLGLSVSEVSEDFLHREVVWMDLVDLTAFRHRAPMTREECDLYHTRNFADWVEHFVRDHMEFFDYADLILIEKQPPQGLVAVEQLLFARFRHKTQLIHPRRVHAYLRIGHLDYEDRKKAVVQIVERELCPYEKMLEQFSFYSRQHDVADSLALLLYYCARKSVEYRQQKQREMWSRDETGMTYVERLERFRFVDDRI